MGQRSRFLVIHSGTQALCREPALVRPRSTPLQALTVPSKSEGTAQREHRGIKQCPHRKGQVKVGLNTQRQLWGGEHVIIILKEKES